MDKNDRLKLLQLLKLYADKGNQEGIARVQKLLGASTEVEETVYERPALTERHPPAVSEDRMFFQGIPGRQTGTTVPDWLSNPIRDVISLGGPLGLRGQLARPGAEEISESVMTSPNLQMAGAALGTGVGMPLGPLGMAGGSVLGTSLGEALYQASQGASLPEAAEDIAKAAAWDMAFVGATEQIPRIWSAAKNSVLGKMLGITKEAAGEWVAKFGRQKVPVGIIDISKNAFARGFRSTIGKFPILGGPFKRGQQERAVALAARQDEILDAIGPVVTANRLGINIAENAKNTSREMKDFYRLLYTQADDLAIDAGALVPTAGLKGLAKALRAKQGRPLLEESVTEVVPGSRVLDASGKPVVEETTEAVVRQTEMSPPKRDEAQVYIQQFDNLPEYISVKELRAIAKDLNVMSDSAGAKGFNLFELQEAKGATEEAMLALDLSKVGAELADQIKASYELANSVFMNTQIAIGESKRVTNPVANIIRRAGTEILGGKQRAGNLNADELADLVFRSGSPQSIRQLRTLVGEDLTRQLARRWFDVAISNSSVRTPAGILKEEAVQIDPTKLMNSLGLSVKSKASRESLAEALWGSGVSVKDIEDFADILTTFDNILVPSTFLARRMTLGGFRSLVKGATGAGALAAGTSLSPVPAIIGTLLIRKGARLLTSPKVLKDVIKFAKMDPNLNRKAFAQMMTRLMRVAITQGSDDIGLITGLREKFSETDMPDIQETISTLSTPVFDVEKVTSNFYTPR